VGVYCSLVLNRPRSAFGFAVLASTICTSMAYFRYLLPPRESVITNVWNIRATEERCRYFFFVEDYIVSFLSVPFHSISFTLFDSTFIYICASSFFL
jgi:hypothetical protein